MRETQTSHETGKAL